MTDFVKETIRQIKRAKIREPRDDQRVGPCHWSKTGWAIVESDGCCTCQPAKTPAMTSTQSATTNRNLVESLCEDCPPVGYETDKTRCLVCPRCASQVTSTNRGAPDAS